MTPPLPSALRLSTRARDPRAPPPPFALGAWSTEADALAVLLDATETSVDDISAVADQIPRATALPPGTLLFVLGRAATSAGMVRRLFGARSIPVAPAVRCTALLARGYVALGAGPDPKSGADLVWGWSTPVS